MDNFIKTLLIAWLMIMPSTQCMQRVLQLGSPFQSTVQKACLSKLDHKVTSGTVMSLAAITNKHIHNNPEQEKKELIYKPQDKHHNITTIFAHGLYGDYRHGLAYHVDTKHPHVFPHAYIEGPLHVFDFDDAHDPKKSCLGQDADMARLHDVCKQNDQAILEGSSRGAVAGLNYLGKYQPKNIRAAIFESPFDKLSTIVKHDAYFEFLELVLPYIPYKGFPNYNPYGIQPIDVVNKIDQNLPILFICSSQDTRIPAKSTINIYKKLLESGHKNVYLLHVEHGEHATIMQGEDGPLVKHVVHAFLAHCNLAYNKSWAEAGQERFKLCQPSLQDFEAEQTQDIIENWCSC